MFNRENERDWSQRRRKCNGGLHEHLFGEIGIANALLHGQEGHAEERTM